MNKLFSLLKATMSGDMNIFKVKTSKKNKIGNALLMIFLLICLMGTSFAYAFMIAEPLKNFGLTYVMLSLFAIASTVLVFVEGIYKSQGILFDAKDNDMLFAMPIKKSTIITARLIKLISFEYIFNFIIMIPAFAVYAIFEHPGVLYYVICLIMFILIPIIPTILSSIIGYIIKATSSIFKKKRLIQNAGTLVFTLGILILSFKMQDFITGIAQNATSINEIISKIYYPVGLFIKCIIEFNIVDLVLLVVINVVLAIAYIFVFSTIYFKVISKLSENGGGEKYSFKNKKFEINSQMKALVKKELKKYFSSSIYFMNTFFGVILIIIMSVAMSINLEGTIQTVTAGEGIGMSMESLNQIIPKVYMGMLLFMISTIAITASAISIEGKSFGLTKSLPISIKKIFLSKIIMSNIVAIPLTLISAVFVIVRLKFNLFDSIITLIISIIWPIIISVFGLIANLKYPLMNAKNEVAVVKQSTASLVAILGGIVLSIIPIGLGFAVSKYINTNIYIILITGLYILVGIILWEILNKYGVKKFNEINV